MKKLTFFLIIISFWACQDSKNTENQTKTDSLKTENKGVGDVLSIHLDSTINEEMVSRGKVIFDQNCSRCHALTEAKTVAPGFKGVTQKRTPEWIMNMITNTTQMLEQDADAKELLEKAKIHMPQHPLSVADARDILEFLRKNDQSK